MCKIYSQDSLFSTLPLLSSRTSLKSSHSTNQKCSSLGISFAGFRINLVTSSPRISTLRSHLLHDTISFEIVPSCNDLYPCSARGSYICYVLRSRSTLPIYSAEWERLCTSRFARRISPLIFLEADLVFFIHIFRNEDSIYFTYTLDRVDSFPQGIHLKFVFEV